MREEPARTDGDGIGPPGCSRIAPEISVPYRSIKPCPTNDPNEWLKRTIGLPGCVLVSRVRFPAVFHDTVKAVSVGKIAQFIERSGGELVSAVVRGEYRIPRGDGGLGKALIAHRVFGHAVANLKDGRRGRAWEPGVHGNAFSIVHFEVKSVSALINFSLPLCYTRFSMTIIAEKMVAGGTALGRIDGKTYFIQGALPGETLDIEITENARTTPSRASFR